MQVVYDIMVCAVGETTATFGVPGVMEHCYFMKASFLTPHDIQSCLSLSRLTYAEAASQLPTTQAVKIGHYHAVSLDTGKLQPLRQQHPV